MVLAWTRLRALAAKFKSNVILMLTQIVLGKELRDFLLEFIKEMQKTYEFEQLRISKISKDLGDQKNLLGVCLGSWVVKVVQITAATVTGRCWVLGTERSQMLLYVKVPLPLFYQEQDQSHDNRSGKIRKGVWHCTATSKRVLPGQGSWKLWELTSSSPNTYTHPPSYFFCSSSSILVA